MKYTKHEKQTILIGLSAMICMIIPFLIIAFAEANCAAIIIWLDTLFGCYLTETYSKRRDDEDIIKH